MEGPPGPSPGPEVRTCGEGTLRQLLRSGSPSIHSPLCLSFRLPPLLLYSSILSTFSHIHLPCWNSTNHTFMPLFVYHTFETARSMAVIVLRSTSVSQFMAEMVNSLKLEKRNSFFSAIHHVEHERVILVMLYPAATSASLTPFVPLVYPPTTSHRFDYDSYFRPVVFIPLRKCGKLCVHMLSLISQVAAS